MHLRNVPVNSSILGKDALATEPDIKQVFITGASDTANLERTLYIIRKRIEKRIQHKDFYIVSLSSKNIVYKGMLSSMQVREYFPDLTQPYFTSGLAVVHSRFSTNTFPTWSLAQPFRLLAHNGEINTIRGNRAWMEARESVLSTPLLGNVKDIRPIIQPNMSDSASLDNVLEFFVMSGLSLPHAMAMLVPESFNDKNPISEDLKAFYEYHSILMEPWDGPAALLFSDGRYAGGMLDRNGLRPGPLPDYQERYHGGSKRSRSHQLRAGRYQGERPSTAGKNSIGRYTGRENILRRRTERAIGNRQAIPSMAFDEPY